MKKMALDIYDDMPRGMRIYISNYGWNFNKKACDYAVSLMKKRSITGKGDSIDAWSKEQVEELLKKNNIKLENDVMYNSTFVCNMARADYWKSSIADEQHLALFVKDYIDDVDGGSEIPFRRWVATMVGVGMPIEWEDLI